MTSRAVTLPVEGSGPVRDIMLRVVEARVNTRPCCRAGVGVRTPVEENELFRWEEDMSFGLEGLEARLKGDRTQNSTVPRP